MPLRPKRDTILTEYSCPFGGKKLSDEKWIYSHPGGANNLRTAYEVEEHASNMLFLSYHTGHSIDKCYKVGAKYDYKLPPQTAMHKEINQIFLNVQKKYPIHAYMNQLYTFLLTIAIISSWFWFLFRPSILSRFSYGFFALSGGFAIHHTRHHCGKLYTYSSKLESFMKPIYEWFWCVQFGMSAKRWIDVHQKSHHVYTNSVEDNDVWMTYPAIIESLSYKARPWHRYQSFYAVIIYGLLALTIPVRILVPRDTITGKKVNTPWYLVLHIIINFVIPVWYHNGSMYPIYLYLISSIFNALCNAYLFQVSHNQENLTHFKVDIDDNNTSDDTQVMKNYDAWLKQQIQSSMSYNNTPGIFNYMFTMVFGGINCQIEHHIAPGIYPIYHIFAAKEIKLFCKKYDIAYVERKGFMDSVINFHVYLHQIAAIALDGNKTD